MADVTSSLKTRPQPTYKSVQYRDLSDGQGDDLSGSSETPSYRRVVYRVYLWRWFMLASLCILNISNGMVS